MTETVHIDKDLEELIPSFVEITASNCKKIIEAAKTGDLSPATIQGHQMKGSGGGYGFDKVTELGALIETAGKNNNAQAAISNAEALLLYIQTVNIVYD